MAEAARTPIEDCFDHVFVSEEIDVRDCAFYGYGRR